MFHLDVIPSIISAYHYQYIVFVWSADARAHLLLELESAELVSALPALASAVNCFDVVALRPRVKSKKRVARSVLRDVLGTTQLVLLYTLDGHMHGSDFFAALSETVPCIMYCVNAPVLLHLPDNVVTQVHERFTQQVCAGDEALHGRICEVTQVGALLFEADDYDEYDPALQLSFE